MSEKKESAFAQGLSKLVKPTIEEEIAGKLDAESYKDLISALSNLSVSVNTIRLALADCGISVTSSAVRNLREKSYNLGKNAK
jgi:hypothetical protein